MNIYYLLYKNIHIIRVAENLSTVTLIRFDQIGVNNIIFLNHHTA